MTENVNGLAFSIIIILTHSVKESNKECVWVRMIIK